MKTFAAALLCALLAGCAPSPSPSFSPPPSVAPASGIPSASLPTSRLSETVICVPETGPLPSALGDPCPSAIAAIRAVVEPLGELIAQIYVEPGSFDCGVLWPGVESPLLCPGALMLPGSAMHGWVSFSGTAKVAAVSLFRSVPVSEVIPSAVPPWTASLAAFIVPPTGWSMP